MIRASLLVLSIVALSVPARAADRAPADVLKELDATVLPELTPAVRSDPAAQRKYIEETEKASERRAALILELFKADPKHARLIELLPERWSSLPVSGPRADDLLKEIDEAVATIRDKKLDVEAAFMKVGIAFYRSQGDLKMVLPALDAFQKLAPQDERVLQLLVVISQRTRDEAQRAILEDRILKDFPDSPVVTEIKGMRRRRDSVGKPFELEFTDAVKGGKVSMKGLKGKVVIVDFWATWCGPCIAELPHMKELYDQYHEKGLEIVGVSLDQPEDQGGLKDLRDFVHERQIPWPQYYQGQGWESAFSTSWGIASIPAVFVIDRDGNLASADARGQLDELVPKLLEQPAKPAP